MVLGDDVELVAAADQGDAEAGADVEVDADKNAVPVLGLGVAPVFVADEWVVDRCIFEVGELAFDVAGDEICFIIGIEGFDESGGQVGVICGFGFDEAAVGAITLLDECAVHPFVTFGGGCNCKLGIFAAAEAGEDHFASFLGDICGAGVYFVGEAEGEVLAADAVPRLCGAAEEGGGAERGVDDVLGLGGDAEVVFDLVLFEEVVEAAHPDVAQEDVGGFEDRADGAGVVEGQDDGFGAEAAGLAGAEAGAEAEDQVGGVFDEVALGWEEALDDAGAEGVVVEGAAGAGAERGLEAWACRDPIQQ